MFKLRMMLKPGSELPSQATSGRTPAGPGQGWPIGACGVNSHPGVGSAPCKLLVEKFVALNFAVDIDPDPSGGWLVAQDISCHQQRKFVIVLLHCGE